MNASSFSRTLATALVTAALGTPVASSAEVPANEIPSEELELYVREQSIRKEIEQAEKERSKLEDELKTFESSIETMKTEALSDYREKLRRPGLSDADKASARSAYEKRCEEIEAKLAAKKRQTETARTAVDERLGRSWLETGLEGEGVKIERALQKTVEIAAAGALSRLLNNGMVSIPGKDYWMGRYEVEQALWQAVMGDNPSLLKGAHRPVEKVSWNDVQEFLRKLNTMPVVIERDIEFRLPTEQEWEYACRAGATGDYCRLADETEITKDTLGEVAWFEDNDDKLTHPVGQKKPNAFGLYDMHGNVYEWTSTTVGEELVVRGGSKGGWAMFCESSHRSEDSPSYRDSVIGFRLCADRNNKEAAANGSPEVLKGEEASDSALPTLVAEDQSSSMTENSRTIDTLVENMVQIPGRNYKMGKYEVTQTEWEAVMGNNPSEIKNPDNPVENVSWQDCQEFLKKLNGVSQSKESGLTFRLPTNEEWEYACRAGATGDYCKLADGTEITEATLDEVAWFGDNAEKTHPVGQKKPNAFGLYDMHGNVLELCQDEYGSFEPLAKRTSKGHDRVGRGGSKGLPAWLCKSSIRRLWFSPSYRFHNLGFRLCANEN